MNEMKEDVRPNFPSLDYVGNVSHLKKNKTKRKYNFCPWQERATSSSRLSSEVSEDMALWSGFLEDMVGSRATRKEDKVLSKTRSKDHIIAVSCSKGRRQTSPSQSNDEKSIHTFFTQTMKPTGWLWAVCYNSSWTNLGGCSEHRMGKRWENKVHCIEPLAGIVRHKCSKVINKGKSIPIAMPFHLWNFFRSWK